MSRNSLKTALVAALTLTTIGSAGLHAADRGLLLQRATTNVQMAPTANRAIVKMKLSFNCVVSGTPVEFPDDISISHNYNFTVPAGTMIAYTAPFGNSGTVALPALAPGKRFVVSHAVPGGITAGAPCTATQL
ncbi:MAG: hypothetical protein LJE68_04065 [Rhodobacter sp.]|nr:hypothetical protein [Rhodobacter sp.]